MSFYERYAECCQRKGILPVSLAAADAMGCSKATISAFAKNRTTPRGDFVAGAARMLDVSADYLLGLIDQPHEIEVESNLTQKEQELVRLLRELNDEGVDAAFAMLMGLHSQDIYKKGHLFESEEKRA